jgi:hypothetical protein
MNDLGTMAGLHALRERGSPLWLLLNLSNIDGRQICIVVHVYGCTRGFRSMAPQRSLARTFLCLSFRLASLFCCNGSKFTFIVCRPWLGKWASEDSLLQREKGKSGHRTAAPRDPHHLMGCGRHDARNSTLDR